MFCPRCGKPLEQGAAFCIACGCRVAAGAAPAQGVSAGLWLGLSVAACVVNLALAFVLCLPAVTVVLAVLGIVFAGIAMGRQGAGANAEAASYARTAKVLCIVALSLTALAVLAVLGLVIFAVSVSQLSFGI